MLALQHEGFDVANWFAQKALLPLYSSIPWESLMEGVQTSKNDE